MGIYSTYIALNAVMPVGIPDDMRQRVESKTYTDGCCMIYIIIYIYILHNNIDIYHRSCKHMHGMSTFVQALSRSWKAVYYQLQ